MAQFLLIAIAGTKKSALIPVAEIKVVLETDNPDEAFIAMKDGGEYYAAATFWMIYTGLKSAEPVVDCQLPEDPQ